MKLEIRWHPRVGDAIVQRGIFRHFLKTLSPTDVVVPATPEAVPTVRHIFTMDCQARGAQLFIREVPFNPYEHTFYKEAFWPDSMKVTVGAACPGFDYRVWDRSFYEQAGVDPDQRWACWNSPEEFPPGVFLNRPEGNQRAYLIKNRRQGRKLVLFHETRFKKIPPAVKQRYVGRMDYKCINVTSELGSLINWAPIMADCDEMHMVDSGPANLANCIMAGGSRLTIYAQDTPPPSMLNPRAKGRVNVVCVGKWKPGETSSVCEYRG